MRKLDHAARNKRSKAANSFERIEPEPRLKPRTERQRQKEDAEVARQKKVRDRRMKPGFIAGEIECFDSSLVGRTELIKSTEPDLVNAGKAESPK